METLKLKNISLKGGYRIELSVNQKGLPCAKSMVLLSSGKNKGSYRTIDSYYFQNEENRSKYIESFIKKVVDRENQKQAIIEKKKEVRSNVEHQYKVGQVLYASWGYEQTNIDFYQIVELKGKQAILREIAGEMVEYTSGDSGRIKPKENEFVSEPMKKNVQFYINSKNEPVFYIKMGSSRGHLYLYEAGENGVYNSWGY